MLRLWIKNDNSALKIQGPVIDLFDPELPVLIRKKYRPVLIFLFDITAIKADRPKVLAAASRIYDEVITNSSYTFIAKSPSNTINAMRIKLPKPPKAVYAYRGNSTIALITNVWNAKTKTVLLRLPNYSEGVRISIKW